jgi:hypothetical protein
LEENEPTEAAKHNTEATIESKQPSLCRNGQG